MPPLVSRPPKLKLAIRVNGADYDARIIASLLLGLLSLYSGLYGGGTAWTSVSAVSGTISLGLAVLPALQPLQHQQCQPEACDVSPPAHERTEAPVDNTRFIRYCKSLLSNDEAVRRAKKLRGVKAQLLVKLLRKVLALGADVIDRHSRSVAGDLLFELIHSGATATSYPRPIASPSPPNTFSNVSSGRVLPVRKISIPNAADIAREMHVFREARQANLAVFQDEPEAPPDEADALPNLLQRPLSQHEIISGVVAAVAYLHSLDNPVVHGDIRAANIRVDSVSNEAILEIPYSRWENSDSTTYHLRHSQIVRHLGPEQYSRGAEQSISNNEIPWNDSVTKSSDVFALGMTLYELLTGEKPFPEIEQGEQVLGAVQRGQRPSLSSLSLAKFFSRSRRSSPSAHSSFETDLESGVCPGPQMQSTGSIRNSSSTRQYEQQQRQRTLQTSLVGLLEMMWSQNPDSRPSIHQVEARLEELGRFEELGDMV